MPIGLGGSSRSSMTRATSYSNDSSSQCTSELCQRRPFFFKEHWPDGSFIVHLLRASWFFVNLNSRKLRMFPQYFRIVHPLLSSSGALGSSEAPFGRTKGSSDWQICPRLFDPRDLQGVKRKREFSGAEAICNMKHGTVPPGKLIETNAY